MASVQGLNLCSALLLLSCCYFTAAKFNTIQEGLTDTLKKISDSVPKGPDGLRLSGLQLLKQTYANRPGGRSPADLDEIAGLIATHKRVAAKKLKAEGMRLYARNKTAINKAKEAVKEFDWKPLPHDAPLSAPQINAAVGLDDILVEGDILMTAEQIRSYFGVGKNTSQAGGRAKRQAVTANYTKWPNGKVYYGFDPAFPESGRQAVRVAIAYWEANTCIRFTFVPDIDNSPFSPVIRFFEGNGCWSELGMQSGFARQDLSLAPHCQQVRVVTHEIAHALGVLHEQTRYDRDNYIWVDESNILDEYKGQYNKAGSSWTTNYDKPYDYRGTMHYWDNLWAKDTNKPIMYSLNKNYQMTIGWAQIPTYGDAILLNMHYSCYDKCATSGTVCQNDGRPHPNNCAVCQCPSGFGGNDCSQRQAPSAGINCGATLAASANWQWLSNARTIGDGQDATANLTAPSHCTWHVTAPAGMKIEYYMNYIGINEKPDALCTFACYYGGVSIKGIESNWITEGMRFCCPSQYRILMKTASNLLMIQPWSGYKYTDFQLQYRTECDQSKVACYFNGSPEPLENCGVCKCWLGFGSNDCSQKEPPSAGLSCGQTIVATSDYQYLKVNNQVGNGVAQPTWNTFEESAHCSWHITASAGLQIEYQVDFVGFDGNKDALCNSGCYNGALFVKRGYPDWAAYDRICCDAQTNQPMVTAGNLLVLRPWNNWRYTDFQVRFRVKA